MASNSPVDPKINLDQAKLIRNLAEFGNAVAHPSASDTQLLVPLLGFEACLSWIDQQPEERVRSSVESAAMPLISDQLIRHADLYLQIQVLCCITQVSKITAPRWPYEEKMMKEFFLVLVQLLGKLSSMPDICYDKAIQMLYTIARIRLCSVMAELEMEDSIIEMFGHFVTFIQSRRSDEVFSDMVTIMTRIIETYFVNKGSNPVDRLPVPVNLLRVLLTSVKKDKKEDSPTAWALGKQIFEELQKECSKKFLFRLAEAVRSLAHNVNDYAEIVASICQKEPQKDVQVENMVDKEPASDSADAKQGPSKSMENNPTAQDTNNGISSEQNSLKTLQFGNQTNVSTLIDNAISERDDVPSNNENHLQDFETIPEVENVNVTQAAPKRNNTAVKGSKKQGRKKFLTAMDLETISEAENVNVAQGAPIQDNNGDKVPRGRKPNSKFRYEEGYEFTRLTDETAWPESSTGHKERTTKEKINVLSKKRNVVSLGNESFPDEKRPKKRTKKKGKTVNQDDPEREQAPLPMQVVPADRDGVEKENPPNTDDGLAPNTSSQFELAPVADLPKNQAPELPHTIEPTSSKEEGFGMTFSEMLVGCKIKVLWPEMQQFYVGSVVSYNRETKKHTIYYDDGDEETLNIILEYWRLAENPMLQGGPEAVQGSPSDLNRDDGGGSSNQMEINDAGTSQPKRLALPSE